MEYCYRNKKKPRCNKIYMKLKVEKCEKWLGLYKEMFKQYSNPPHGCHYFDSVHWPGHIKRSNEL